MRPITNSMTSTATARITFWFGYHRSGPARAFGFGITFYPTVAAYAFLLFRMA